MLRPTETSTHRSGRSRPDGDRRCAHPRTQLFRFRFRSSGRRAPNPRGRRAPMAIVVEWCRPLAAPHPPRDDRRHGRDRCPRMGGHAGNHENHQPRSVARRSRSVGCCLCGVGRPHPCGLRSSDPGLPASVADRSRTDRRLTVLASLSHKPARRVRACVARCTGGLQCCPVRGDPEWSQDRGILIAGRAALACLLATLLTFGKLPAPVGGYARPASISIGLMVFFVLVAASAERSHPLQPA